MTTGGEGSMLTTTFAVLLLAALLLLGGCGVAGDRASPSRTVLLTGFEPFGGRDVNESWEAVKVLKGTTLRGRRVEVARLPVVYDEMAAPLAAAIAKARPEVVISFGVGTEVVRVETLARNGYNEIRPLDNLGKPPPRAQVEVTGPATIPTGLPTEALLAALAAADVPARASDDAGGSLCTACFYRLLRTRGPGDDGIRARGFVHVPPGGAANPRGGELDLPTIRRGVKAVVEATLDHLDAAAGGGGGAAR